MPSPLKILQFTPIEPATQARLHTSFDVLRWPADAAAQTRLLDDHAAAIRGIATTGEGKITAAVLDRLPALEIIACYSAGVDGIDLAAAAQRGVAVTNTSSVLAEDVANIALSLLLGVTRQLVPADRHVRSGQWETAKFPLTRTLHRMRVGIVGLGHIGAALAQRVAACGAVPAYTGPRRKPEAAWEFFPDALTLANWAEALVVCCPGGPATHHLINRTILDALGPEGFLVNISRGSVVDEAALCDAIAADRLAGAGLDVFDAEPHVPHILRDSPRTMLLPHIGSATTATRRQMGEHMIEALLARFPT